MDDRQGRKELDVGGESGMMESIQRFGSQDAGVRSVRRIKAAWKIRAAWRDGRARWEMKDLE